jgi:hypothetical protein
MKIFVASIACTQAIDLGTAMLLGGQGGGLFNAMGTNPFYQQQMINKIPDTPTSSLMKHQYVAESTGVDPNSAGVLATWALDQGKDPNTVLANSFMAQQAGLNPTLALTNPQFAENLPLMAAMGGAPDNAAMAMALASGNSDPMTMLAMQNSNNPLAMMALSGDKVDPLTYAAVSGQGLGDIVNDPMMMYAVTEGENKNMLPFMMGGDIAKNPLALMSILGDDSSKLSELLPLMAMTGQSGLDMSNPITMMAMVGDDSDKLKELLPLMAMSGGKPLDPVTMMMMTGENSSMKDLLPLLAMQGGVDLQNNPMALMALIDGDNQNLKEMLPFMAMNGQNGLDKNMLPFILHQEGKDELLQTLALTGGLDGAGIDANTLLTMSMLD